MLAACSSSGNPGNDSAGDAVNEAVAANFVNAMAGLPPAAPAGVPFSLSEKTDLLEFVYAYPAEAAAIPRLVRKFRRDIDTSRADALKMAREDRDAAKAADFPFRGHSLETRWTVAADTPRFLALRSETYVFTGGAHGMTGYEALIWDKARKRETSMAALMTSSADFADAIRDAFCERLDRERAVKRGGPVVRGDDPFTDCIDPMEQVLVPTSRDGKLIDAITVLIGPYAAGPYAEGSYDVTIPVTPAIFATIKTEYQDGFAGGADQESRGTP
ncbi:DUF4163 domain-containing protein [Sphingobium sp. AN641]|uniref:PdaC/SigV domain-containing protein n=1 Tax=Sphingobium sp. AN641 TaxID=3133443 RepID=UPI0030C2901D